MKIAVSSYSFSALLGTGELTQLSCIAKAKELGFDAIEFVDMLPHDGSTPEEYARTLRAECERLSMPISNYTFWAELVNCPDLSAELERVKRQIDIAEILGVKSVRHDATGGFAADKRAFRSFDDALPILIPACRELTEYAAAKGIRTMVENHGFFAQDSRRVEKLVSGVARENFGTLMDMGNFLCADEDPLLACTRVAPYAFYAHAKDFIVKPATGADPGEGFFRSRCGNYLRGTIVGHGAVPVKACLSVLKRAGYDGYLGVEFEGMENTLQALQIGLANLRRYLSEI